MKVILAIDGGGSRTRCRAIDSLCQVVSQSESGPSNHLLVARDVVKRSLTEAINQTLESGGLDRDDVACISAGMAGVDFDGAGAAEMETLLREMGFENLVLNGDMVIAHAGALALKPGVVALAGTGSAILGIGADGQRVKVGGWGPVYGDEGSAYRIAQMALRAAARGYDGRGAATALTARLLRALDLVEFRETVARVYVKGMEPREIAALSRVAYEVAEGGDEVARTIFFLGGDELAESVEASIRQLGLSQREVSVSYQGSVLESCALLRGRFEETLRLLEPKCMVLPPRFEAVLGAYLLGRTALGWVVDSKVLDDLERNISEGEVSTTSR